MKKFLLVVIFPIVVVLYINSLILNFPILTWREPREVLFHVVVTGLLGLLLSRRLSAFSAMVGALLFGVSPTHASHWSVGTLGGMDALVYVLVMACSVFSAYGFHRFFAFLKTQEAVVRYLFLFSVATLILGLASMSVLTNSAWRNKRILLEWRASKHPSVQSLNAWADFLYEDPQNVKDAAETYGRVLKLDRSNQRALFALSGIYLDLARPEDVIRVSNDLLKFYPENEDVLMHIIQRYGAAIQRYPNESIYQEKRESVLASYELLSKRKAYTANDYFNLGFLYEQVGGFEEAMRFYRKAIALDQKHEKALYNLANRYQLAGDPKTAILLYERLVRFYPRGAQAYLNMGIIYNALGDTEKARYLYQKVISLEPANADAFFNLGYLKEAAGEIREALADYEKAIENNPQHAEAYYNMGNAYATLGQIPEAIASYLKTVGINHKHQNAYVNLSILSFKAKDFQGSIQYLEQAQNLGYNPPEEYLKTLEPYRRK